MRLISTGQGKEKSFQLRDGSMIAGRHPSCHIIVPDPQVSKRHLQLHVDGGTVTLRDLDSRNGTSVNGRPVKLHVLEDGDIITLGNHTLTFDATGAAQGHAAGAAGFDFSPTDESEQRPYEPDDSTSAYAPDGPPPSEAQAEPLYDESEMSEDDTPADGQFIPQAYSPENLEPQIIARDGRMFLRNPRTNQEIEIVPRDQDKGPPGLGGYYDEQEATNRRKNLMLVGGAIAVGLLMIIALVLTSGSGDGRPTGPDRPFGHSGYNERLDQSIDLMKEGQFSQALDLLREAERAYPNRDVAGLLRRIGTTWGESGSSIDQFDWREVRAHIRQILESQWRTGTVEAFAADRRNWIEDTDHYDWLAEEAARLLANDEPGEAFEKLAEIQSDNIVYHQTEELRGKVRAAAFQMHVDAGQDALQEQQWDRAVQEFETARNRYAATSEETLKAQELIGLTKDEQAKAEAEAERHRTERAILNEANEHLRRGTLASVRTALETVDRLPEDCLLHQQRDELRDRIRSRLAELEHQELVSTARNYYRDGEGARAIELIDRENLAELSSLRRRITNIQGLLEAANTAYDAKDYNRARANWTEVTEIESDRTNAYRREADQALRRLRNEAADIARHYEELGQQALAQEEYATARRHAQNAVSWDPGNQIGQNTLEQLRHHAEVLYRRARELRIRGERMGDRDDLSRAVELFQNVQQCVGEGVRLYDWAGRHLNELRAQGIPGA